MTRTRNGPGLATRPAQEVTTTTEPIVHPAADYPPMTAPEWQRVRSAKGAPPPRPKAPPGRMGSIFAQLPFVRSASPERRREWRRIMIEARQRAHERRKRVLAHPVIAERLARELGYRVPGHWNGYVPPDDGPARRALVEILNAVVAAEGGDRGAADSDD